MVNVLFEEPSSVSERQGLMGSRQKRLKHVLEWVVILFNKCIKEGKVPRDSQSVHSSII